MKRSTVRQLWDFKDLKAIAVECSNAKLSKSVRRRTLWDFDVERSYLSTSNALRFRRRTLRYFDVERSEISTSNAHRFWVFFWKWMRWQGQESSPCIYARKLSDWPKNMKGRKTHSTKIFLFYFYILISILIFLSYCCILISILSFQIPSLILLF